jgi:nicotinamidase-related amidase
MYTLVVIDMQHCYSSSRNSKLKAEIIRQIDLAKECQFPIILVEMHHTGQTVPSIRSRAGRYRVTTVVKPRCDGSSEVVDRIKKLNLHKKVRMVGVETGVCVRETAEGIVKHRGFSVDLVRAGCYSKYCNNDEVIDGLAKSSRKINVL